MFSFRHKRNTSFYSEGVYEVFLKRQHRFYLFTIVKKWILFDFASSGTYRFSPFLKLANLLFLEVILLRNAHYCFSFKKLLNDFFSESNRLSTSFIMICRITFRNPSLSVGPWTPTLRLTAKFPGLGFIFVANINLELSHF